MKGINCCSLASSLPLLALTTSWLLYQKQAFQRQSYQNDQRFRDCLSGQSNHSWLWLLVPEQFQAGSNLLDHHDRGHDCFGLGGDLLDLAVLAWQPGGDQRDPRRVWPSQGQTSVPHPDLVHESVHARPMGISEHHHGIAQVQMSIRCRLCPNPRAQINGQHL